MKLRLVNKKYKVVLKFTYAEDKRWVSVLLSLNGIKFKTTRELPYDYRIKCYFEDYNQFRGFKTALDKVAYIEVI